MKKIIIAFVSALCLFSCKKNDLPVDGSLFVGESILDSAGNPIYTFYAINAFSPNGDGRNDNFYVYGVGIKNENFSLSIFDRYGNEFFKTVSPKRSWDGRVAGGNYLAQIGCYTCKVILTDTLNNKREYNFSVHLVK